MTYSVKAAVAAAALAITALATPLAASAQAPGSGGTAPSYAASVKLQSTLTAIKPLNGRDFGTLKSWIANPSAPAPSSPGSALTTESGKPIALEGGRGVLVVESPLSTAAAAVKGLDRDDLAALQAWLAGKGRAALRARGATDKMIGAMRLDTDLLGDAPLG
jgi:hypothetical protein